MSSLRFLSPKLSSRSLRSIQSRRTLFGFGKKPVPVSPFEPLPPPLLSQDDLFHPLSTSPFKEMREKSKRIKELAYDPVALERGENVKVAFECPDCGFPTHATEESWSADEEKGRYWPRLREANEDEHDLRSGREMTEFKLPGNVSSVFQISGLNVVLIQDAYVLSGTTLRGSGVDGKLGCIPLYSRVPLYRH